MIRPAGSGVKVVCGRDRQVALLTSCAKGTGLAATPQGNAASMLSHDDLASVSPALERYRREALGGPCGRARSLAARPTASSRSRP
jgi:hypothetical protein